MAASGGFVTNKIYFVEKHNWTWQEWCEVQGSCVSSGEAPYTSLLTVRKSLKYRPKRPTKESSVYDTVEKQASQTLHQDDTIASQNPAR